jgi:type III secretion system YseE family protein
MTIHGIDLKASFIEPLSAARREQVAQQLDAARAALRDQLRRGGKPAEFPALQELLAAVEAAQNIVAGQDA